MDPLDRLIEVVSPEDMLAMRRDAEQRDTIFKLQRQIRRWKRKCKILVIERDTFQQELQIAYGALFKASTKAVIAEVDQQLDAIDAQRKKAIRAIRARR